MKLSLQAAYAIGVADQKRASGMPDPFWVQFLSFSYSFQANQLRFD